MKKLKVAIVSPWGAEPRYDNYPEFVLAHGLNKLGHDVQCHTYKVRSKLRYRENFIYKGIKIKRCRQFQGISPGLFFSIIRFRPNILIYFHSTSYLNFSAYMAGRAVKAKIFSEVVGMLHNPFITTNTDDPINNLRDNINLLINWRDLPRALITGQWLNLIFHLPMAKADTIIAINKGEQEYIKKYYNRDSIHIYSGMPKNNYKQEIKPAEIEKNIIFDRYLFLIGQNKKRKGWDTAIEAIALFKKQGVKKNLVFIYPSLEINEAENYAKELGVRDQVYFFPRVSNKERNWLYNHAQYVLVPSRYESFGLPVFEAFQAGKPLLATDIPVFLEFLEHKKNAMISKAGSAEELVNNIKTLDKDPALVNNLVKEGKITLADFSSKIMVDNYLKIF